MKLLKIGLFSALCGASMQLHAATCVYSIESEWNSGFVGKVTITNNDPSPINSWDVSWQYTDGTVFTSGWNAQFSGTGPVSASNLNWNGQIATGQSVAFGFQGNKGVQNAPAPIVDVSGAVCSDIIDVNLPPVASFSSSSMGLNASFNASASSDPENATLTYTWDFGDNTTGSGVSPNHAYAAANTYEVTLTVSDGANSTQLSQMVEISVDQVNRAPTALISASSAGLTTQFNGSGSTDPDNDALTYAWDFGDNTSSTLANPSHTYATPGTYVVGLTVSDSQLNDTATTSVSVDVQQVGTHLANPFLGADSYINADYANLIDTSIALESDPALIAKMEAVKAVPTAVWLDRIEAIFGGSTNSGRKSLEQHLLAALNQKRAGVPMLVSIVVYNLPDRDCAALASNGTLSSDANGLEIYKRDYIDVIASIASDPRFSDLRIVATIEPDSLPNLVTNTSVAKCGKVATDGTYVNGIQYALSKFSEISNVYTYLDIAHSGWLGWENNLQGVVQLYTDLVQGVNNGDMTVVDGFISNVSNYTPVEEIFLPDPSFDFDGDFQGVLSSSYFQYNPVFDEKDFAEELHSRFVATGFPQDIAMLIDTSRNGWGGPNRPSAANINATTEDQYVNDSRLDKRNHRGNWCNVSGAGIGERPQALPYGSTSPVEAFIWIKPPGESDGTSDSNQTTPDSEGKSFDPNCSPTFTTQDGVLTGALPNAPAAGAWFPEQFKTLVESANPAL